MISKNPLSAIDSFYVILGSQSPRRKSLLSSLGITFKILVSNVDEDIPLNMNPHDVPAYLSKLKSDALMTKVRDNYLLITADTVVIHENLILGKPKDKDDAMDMLAKLSDDIHTVVTGVTIRSTAQIHTFSSSTHVTMSAMNNQEIKWYIDNYEVMDKAGSYGIQDWLGVSKIKNLQGSYYNVMGLPTDQLYQVLKRW